MTEQFDKAHFIEVLEALHRDQTGLAAALNRVRDIVSGYEWLAEGGRGSHEYDDDSYYEEIGNCLDAVKEEIDRSLRVSGRSHEICCGKYRHVARHPTVPTQRRLRAMQVYTEFADEMMDYALIEGDDGEDN